jgi:hypothetical protein
LTDDSRTAIGCPRTMAAVGACFPVWRSPAGDVRSGRLRRLMHRFHEAGEPVDGAITYIKAFLRSMGRGRRTHTSSCAERSCAWSVRCSSPQAFAFGRKAIEARFPPELGDRAATSS